MDFSILALAALAAAQGAAPAHVDAEQARAAGFAQAQHALAQSSETPADRVPATTPSALGSAVPSAAVGGTIGGEHALALTCEGAGTADKQRGSFVGGGWGWASVVTHHDRQFNDQIDVRLFSGDDRIRLPRTMLPGFHGGADGWFKLKDVVADARAIHAHAAVAAFHNPQIYIDRVTGTISISGKSGDYSGQCQVIDANAAAKF
jgi:hypothetical protein